jgi:hypothetical protein
MKTLSLLFVGILILMGGHAQNKIVDPDKPISNIDISYSVNDNLTFTLLLNAKENTQSISTTSPVNFKATVEGQINWAAQPADPNENLVLGTFILSSLNTPFKYTADLKNGLGTNIPITTKRNWTSIQNVKIKYEVDGKFNELPSTTIYLSSCKIARDSQRHKSLRQRQNVGKKKSCDLS